VVVFALELDECSFNMAEHGSKMGRFASRISFVKTWRRYFVTETK
jgi:hypothetical protein